ncbi:MAG: hypothetical protein JSS74_11925, partial [Actinobacteria bacterium]|nr:hypothetical protein [Actinomycetota bacterium]
MLAFAAALVLLLLIGVGVYGLVRGPAPHPASGLPASPDPGRHDAVPSPTPGPLLLTNNPEQFA